MKVLVVGSGGREAALAWTIARSPFVKSVIVSPRHPAVASLDPKISTQELDLTENYDLAVIGPESYLSEGLADELRRRRIPTVGPSQKASRLECSKVFAKKMMEKARIPTARFASFNQLVPALSFIEICPWQGIVVKADGPAQGKGVIVCATKAEAQAAVISLMDGSYLGQKISTIVLEERLFGEELSAFALCDGENFVHLGVAKDHKRLLSGDQGPNTGGMGVISPVPLSQDEQKELNQKIFTPILKAMKSEGCAFNGFLFAGLMRTSEGLKVLEFNVRLGDPEAQALLPRLEEDLLPWLIGCAEGVLPLIPPRMSPEPHVHVVLAAPGYPGTEGRQIRLGDEVLWKKVETSQLVFPAGLTIDREAWVSRGGRILGVTAKGKNRQEALDLALADIHKLSFEGAQWREDIGEMR